MFKLISEFNQLPVTGNRELVNKFASLIDFH